MQPIVRALGAVLASSALVVTAGGVAFAQEEQEAAVAPIDWKPCPEKPEVECGTLTLPIDWKNPGGEKFGLAVARRKATDQAHRVGSLVINPGGPGGSGVDFAMFADTYFSPEIAQKFDFIGFDPRGVGRSQPIKCSLDLLQKTPSEYPKNIAEYDQYVAFNKELRADCAKQSGPIFDHASTADVVQDIDAIRRSLGEKKISYYGVSYGTIMGQQYAERYGKNIRAMVIDSNMDHSLDTRSFVLSEARTAEDSFNEWVKWNNRTPSSPLHGKDVKKIWNDLLAKADRGELTDPGSGQKITGQMLTGAVVSMAYGPAWKQFSQLVDSLAKGAPVPSVASAFGDTVPNPFPGIFCNDFNLRISSYGEYQRLTTAENLVAPHTRGSSLGHGATMGCIGFPPATNPPHPLRIRNAPKILLTNAKHDPATAYEWAVNAHRQSRDTTVFVTYDGWGHGVYDRSECTKSINDRYLVDLKLPKDGTHCAAVEPVDTASLSVQEGTVRPGRPFSVR
ncbi:peptidase [Lentzea sp. NBRC 105346]|uniref:alpha/beta hydrolase n=1 Tax=Lentzea sp. NBRC 105346 TaxID=3032205 RepID=UPI0024A3E876|nr:alpha/beta hydrolase [Lentzea sp. NBRC 105346]GLZ31349.1 peptidase [Lentzea sp. NBRC 105346]